MSDQDDGTVEAGTRQGKRSGLLAFFGTFPGIITALATLITAIAGLIVVLRSGDDDPAAPPAEPVPSTQPTSTQPTSTQPTSTPPQPSTVPSPSRTAQVVNLGKPARTVKLSVKAGDYVQPVVWTIANSAKSFSDISIQSDPANNRMTFLVGPLGEVFFAAGDEISRSACRANLAVRKDQELRVDDSTQGNWTCMLVGTKVGAMRMDRIDALGGTADITIVVW